jgi:hypothetical protein
MLRVRLLTCLSLSSCKDEQTHDLIHYYLMMLPYYTVLFSAHLLLQQKKMPTNLKYSQYRSRAV